MDTQLMETARGFAALSLGIAIGVGFGLLQAAAHRRNEKLQDDGRLTSGWAVMPGSARRVAYLLAALVLIQLVSPALFAGASAWWVSAGVGGGYGAMLFRQLWQARQGTAATPPPRGRGST